MVLMTVVAQHKVTGNCRLFLQACLWNFAQYLPLSTPWPYIRSRIYTYIKDCECVALISEDVHKWLERVMLVIIQFGLGHIWVHTVIRMWQQMSQITFECGALRHVSTSLKESLFGYIWKLLANHWSVFTPVSLLWLNFWCFLVTFYTCKPHILISECKSGSDIWSTVIKARIKWHVKNLSWFMKILIW